MKDNPFPIPWIIPTTTFDFMQELLWFEPRSPMYLPSHRRPVRIADPEKKAQRKRQKAARAKGRKAR